MFGLQSVPTMKYESLSRGWLIAKFPPTSKGITASRRHSTLPPKIGTSHGEKTLAKTTFARQPPPIHGQEQKHVIWIGLRYGLQATPTGTGSTASVDVEVETGIGFNYTSHMHKKLGHNT